MRSKQWQLQITADTARRAFTLVELLVVGVIIAILVALILFVMNRVANTTKETRTRATIQKLDVAMQQIFMTYEREFAFIKNRVRTHPDYSEFSPEDKQKIATHFIRDLMRMEMPQSWAEVYNSAGTPDAYDIRPKLGPLPITLNGASVRVAESPLLEYYWQAYSQVRRATGREPGRAALLFLIIQNLNPEALESFHGREVADTDGDGLLEFVDAWGNPIQFLRWAPAFPGSDVQQDVVRMAGGLPHPSPGVASAGRADNEDWWRTRGTQQLQDAMQRASAFHADPMDERISVDGETVGWFLYPLIYSAGPDGRYGLAVETIENGGSPVSPSVNPGEILNPFAPPYGMPYDSFHFDNIHNHRWHRSF